MICDRFKIPTIGAAIIVLALTAAGLAQNDISIQISLDRYAISMGENATLTVSIMAPGQKQLPAPNLPPLEQFDVFPAGTSSNLQIMNGAVSYSQSYNFILSPKQEGTFPIRPASVVINGKRYESNEVSLKVAKAGAPSGSPGKSAMDESGSARDLFLTAEVDKKTACVDEQITLRVKYFSGIKTLSVPNYNPPSTPDFWSSEIPPQKQYYQTVNGRDYMVIEVNAALFPTKPGRLTIGQARITATVPDRSQTRSRDPYDFFGDIFQQGKNIEITSQPLAVDIKPLPDEGKPAAFSGGVGNYKISAEVDKTDAEVNQAITLTVKISGRGNVKSIPEPTLPRLDDFRVEKSNSDQKVANVGDQVGGTKTYDYVLIPRLPGRHTIDPITLNYFDPERKAYASVHTEPIALNIKQGELASSGEIPYNMVSGQTINLKETDIRFIKPSHGPWRRVGGILLTSPGFLTVAIIPALAVLGGLVDVRRRRRLEGDVAYARLRKANAVAKKRLKKAEELLTGSDSVAFYAELSGVVLQFVADKFNLSALGLTSEQVDELLRQKNVTETLCGAVQDVLKEADFGRFAGAAGDLTAKQQLYERARQVVIGLEEAL